MRARPSVCCEQQFLRISIGYKNKVKTGETEGLSATKIHTTSYPLNIWSLIETRTDLDPSVWSLMGKSCGFTMESLAAFNEVLDFSPAAFNWALGALGRSSRVSSKWVGAGVLVPGAYIKIWQTWNSSSTIILSLYSASPLTPALFVLESHNIENKTWKTSYLKSNHTFFCWHA